MKIMKFLAILGSAGCAASVASADSPETPESILGEENVWVVQKSTDTFLHMIIITVLCAALMYMIHKTAMLTEALKDLKKKTDDELNNMKNVASNERARADFAAEFAEAADAATKRMKSEIKTSGSYGKGRGKLGKGQKVLDGGMCEVDGTDSEDSDTMRTSLTTRMLLFHTNSGDKLHTHRLCPHIRNHRTTTVQLCKTCLKHEKEVRMNIEMC